MFNNNGKVPKVSSFAMSATENAKAREYARIRRGVLEGNTVAGLVLFSPDVAPGEAGHFTTVNVKDLMKLPPGVSAVRPMSSSYRVIIQRINYTAIDAWDSCVFARIEKG